VTGYEYFCDGFDRSECKGALVRYTCTYLSCRIAYIQTCGQPPDNRGSFTSDFRPFQGLKIDVPSGCLGETSIFKIIMIDDVSSWSKLESTR